jgi:hypothetical protein
MGGRSRRALLVEFSPALAVFRYLIAAPNNGSQFLERYLAVEHLFETPRLLDGWFVVRGDLPR